MRLRSNDEILDDPGKEAHNAHSRHLELLLLGTTNYVRFESEDLR